MKTIVAALASVLMTSAAFAVEPVGSDTFNTDPGFDLSSLDASNFYSVIEPMAKEEGTLTFFDFTNSFGPLFSEHLIPEFEAKYGITVDYVRGDNDAAVQQLIAAHNAGSPAPADAYFIGSGAIGNLMSESVMANIPLIKLLPNADTFDEMIATVTRGFEHGGSYLPFHRNQTSILYDTRVVSADEVPTDLDGLLAWAKAHPQQFIVTSPKGGGSGSGFLQSVAYAKVTDPACKAGLVNYKLSDDEAKALVAKPCMQPVWDYYKELLPVVELTNGNSDTLNLVATGAGVIGTAWEDMAYDFMGRGLLPPTSRQELVVTGQVGGGDGMFFPVDGEHPAAGLLFLDFMMGHDVQLQKLQINGSRSARLDIDPAQSFTPEQVARLIPTDQFMSRALESMPNNVNSALGEYFVANLLRQ
ncbi:MAG: extracellular solute-binding protein [Alphaproteobacteria bacterium]|nr:extracellular solute-binding protein [Alphaproteobacteria bacterium]